MNYTLLHRFANISNLFRKQNSNLFSTKSNTQQTFNSVLKLNQCNNHVKLLSSSSPSITASTPISLKNHYNNLYNQNLKSQNQRYYSIQQSTNISSAIEPIVNHNNTSSNNKNNPKPIEDKPKSWYKKYTTLIKLPITVYVTFTAVAGYVATCPDNIWSWTTLSMVTVGTFFCSASANIFNQEMEVQYDKQMARTKSRPLVTGEIDKDKALFGAIACLSAGGGTLLFCQPVAGALGIINIFFYITYTEMKRTTAWNTWVGAIVGAIPPMIGTVAAAHAIEPIGVFLFTYLFLWQIPHFLALSENLKTQYQNAGYKMLVVTKPTWVQPVANMHIFAGAVLPWLSYYYEYANIDLIPTALISATFVGMYLPHLFKDRGIFKNKKTSTNVYKLTLFSLPATLLLLMAFRLPFEYI
ncbi:putative heme A:farnesyltransferase [Tieghemostelium lacteum]|uniref:Protoheme IX farnesyltransferase, mitochondrial n=1 Tax=Tieghemostelium lacteum TaxID=361077 RepID=A0A151Z739_TIELA|nr:putative heme A:farnesyltransferase [Tieghemostelium lacteum]|eukprot:KYQ89780.1 putative heme A:farnesyltransferase [Tieghemostelium lacteum]